MESKNAEKIIAKFIKDLDISSDDYITVAELSTTLADGLTKTIDTNTALISDTLIRKIKSSQINPVHITIKITDTNLPFGYTFQTLLG